MKYGTNKRKEKVRKDFTNQLLEYEYDFFLNVLIDYHWELTILLYFTRLHSSFKKTSLEINWTFNMQQSVDEVLCFGKESILNKVNKRQTLPKCFVWSQGTSQKHSIKSQCPFLNCMSYHYILTSHKCALCRRGANNLSLWKGVSTKTSKLNMIIVIGSTIYWILSCCVVSFFLNLLYLKVGCREL